MQTINQQDTQPKDDEQQVVPSVESRGIVDDVIASVLGVDPSEGDERPDLEDQIERVAEEYDRRTAESFCRTLIDYLTEHPRSVDELEALLMLGLAHPRLLSRHRIPVLQESRRLAVLLEDQGEPGRAQGILEAVASRNPDNKALDHELASMMRRNGNGDRLVQRYLRRAEVAVREGRRKDAITWLREVLLIDRSRRDVARMIRDLRYEEVETKVAWRKRLQLACVVLFLFALASGFFAREWLIGQRYATLPETKPGDIASMQLRLEELDHLIAANPLWLGMFRAGRERVRLRTGIDKLQALAAEQDRIAMEERETRVQMADSARMVARMAAEQGAFDRALAKFREALRVAPPEWEPRERVESDIQAIEDWMLQEASSGGGGRQ